MRIEEVSANWIRVPLADTRQHVSDFGRVSTFDTMIVAVRTDAGLIGFGEGKNAVGSAGDCGTLARLVNHEFGPRLVGLDPRHIVKNWDLLYNGVRAGLAIDRGRVFPDLARRGLSVSAISSIDIALWDILGQFLSVPICQLLGGPKAEHLPAYASGGWAPAEAIGEELLRYVDSAGFRAVKMRIGAMDGSVRASADRVIAAREALGPAVELMCDAHGTYSVAEAKRFCYQVADCDLRWFEEPVSADDKNGMAEVRSSSHIPIAAGESEFTRFDFRDLISARAVDVLQPDLAICGGITEGIRIGALAAAHNLELALHLWGGAVNFAAGLHVAAASTASRIIEYPLGANPALNDLIEEDFIVTDGVIRVPTAPGLGVTVRQEFIEEYAVSPQD